MRTFEVGDLVLFRNPNMSSKLDDSWEGPHKVLAKMGIVNYKIGKVEVESEDREKTRFLCLFGKLQYRRMQFGLCNAPSMIERLMD